MHSWDESGLAVEYVPISTLDVWPGNPKDHDLGAIGQSIRRFGFVNPIILDAATGRIVAGHGRLKYLLFLAEQGEVCESPPKGIHVHTNGEWLVPAVRIAFRNENEARAYLLADNRITEVGGWNQAALASMLRDAAEHGTIEGTGFDYGDLNALLDRLSDQRQAYLEGQPHGGALLRGSVPGTPDIGSGKPAREVTCPHCGGTFHVKE